MLLARRILPLLLLAVLVVAVTLVGAGPAQAQSTLALSDFDDTGLDVETLALITTSHDTIFYSTGRFGDNGTIVDGDMSMDENGGTLIRLGINSNLTSIRINSDASGTAFNNYFTAGNPGHDLSIYFQTDAATVDSFTVADNLTTPGPGGGYANITVPSDGSRARVNDIDNGDTFIFAIARTQTTLPPVLTPDPDSVSPETNSNQQFATGAPTGVENWTVSETQGTGDFTLHTSQSGLSCSGQTNSISVGAGTSFWVRWCTTGTSVLTVTDADDAANTDSWNLDIAQHNRAPEFSGLTATRSIAENSAEDTDVGDPVTATDADDDTLTYSISGDANFDIVSGSGQIQVAANADIDFESSEVHTVVVTATDPDGATDTITVTINVTNVDERPRLSPDPTGITATDGQNQQFSFTNVGGIQDITVTETQNGGDLTLRTTEEGISCSGQTNTLSVASSSSFWARFCETGSVTLRVADADDSTNHRDYTFTIVDQENRSPHYASPNLTIHVDENTQGGTDIGDPVTATDEGDDPITYSVSGSSNFTINSTTAQLSLADGFRPDFELNSTFNLVVTATDPDLESDSINVLVVVNNLDDAPRLSPDPSTLSPVRNTDQEFSFTNVDHIQTVAFFETDGTGHATLSTTQSGLSCSNDNVQLEVASASSVWMRWCETGTLTITVANAVGGYEARTYSVTVVTDHTAPSQVTGLSITPADRELEASWTAPNNGGSAITDYEYSTNNGATWRSTGSTDPSFTITHSTSGPPYNQLNNGTTYFVRIRAVNAIGTGVASSAVAGTPVEDTVPDAITDLDATAGNGQATLTWTAPDDGGSPITRYEYSTNDGSTWQTTGGTATSYTVTNLSNGTAYQFRVRAVNAVGSASQSNRATATPAGPPGRVTGLQASEGNAQVTLSWKAPSAQGSAITRYDYSSNDGSSWSSTGSTSTSHTVTGLNNEQEYTFRVRAVNAIGNGPQSSSVDATPTSITAPGQVIGLQLAIGDRELHASWTAPGDGGSPIIRYEYSTDGGGFTWRSTGSTSTSYTITETSFPNPTQLNNGTSYTVRVRAVNGSGTGPASAAAHGTPRPAPTVDDVTVSDVTTNGATVDVDLTNQGSQTTDVYLRYRTPAGSGDWTSVAEQETTGTSVEFDLTGLTPGLEYRVQASTQSGFPSSNRDQADFTTTTQVALTPNPATIDPARLTNHRLTPVVSAGVSNVAITLNEPAGDLTLALVETGLDCSSQTNTLTVGAATSFWFRACGSGSVTLTVTDQGDSAVFQDYDVTVALAEVSITAVSVPASEIGRTTAEVQVTLSNPDGVSTTVYYRHRTPPGSGSWTDGGESITTGTSTERTLLSLTANSQYRVQVSLSSGFGTSDEEDFTTDPTPGAVSGVSAGSITSDGATITVTLTNPHSQVETVYTRYRTPPGSGSWSTGPTATTSGTSATVTLSGLERDANYRVEASTSSSFTTSRVTDFTTLEPTLASMAASNITLTGARVTVNIDDTDGDLVTVYLRWRTPPGSGTWSSTVSATTGGTSAHYDIDALSAGTQYRVEASTDNTFPSAGRLQGVFTTTANSAPDFGATTATRSVDENSAAGANVGAPVTATDANSHTLTYSLSGTDASSFAIGSGTGQITVGGSVTLDYETKAAYSVTVTATDTFSATDSIAVTIEVNDIREAGLLGRIVITVGHSGGNYGYDSGSYGSRVSGSFPGGLFGDGNSRTVAEIYEDADGNWYLTYSGGAADDWNDDQEHLDEILVEVEYQDDRDLRSFVLGGFIDSRPGSRGLKLDPPLPSRDWGGRDGENVAIDFRRHRNEATPPVLPPASDEPVAEPGSFGELLNSAPGGPVDLQLMLTNIIFVVLMATPVRGKREQQGWRMIGATIALVLTPWLPVAFGYGDPILSTMISFIIVLVFFGQKMLDRRPD